MRLQLSDNSSILERCPRHAPALTELSKLRVQELQHLLPSNRGQAWLEPAGLGRIARPHSISQPKDRVNSTKSSQHGSLLLRDQGDHLRESETAANQSKSVRIGDSRAAEMQSNHTLEPVALAAEVIASSWTTPSGAHRTRKTFESLFCTVKQMLPLVGLLWSRPSQPTSAARLGIRDAQKKEACALPAPVELGRTPASVSRPSKVFAGDASFQRLRSLAPIPIRPRGARACVEGVREEGEGDLSALLWALARAISESLRQWAAVPL